MGLEETYLPFKRFPELTEDQIIKGSLYETLINKFDTIPTKVSVNFKAIFCDVEICDLLKITREIPILYISDISFDQNDRLFEFSRAYFRGDRFSFHTEINKHQNDNMLFVQRSNSLKEGNNGA